MREREEKREKRRERRRAERRRQSVIPGRRQTKSHGKRESYERKHKLQACFGRPGLGATRRQEDEGENESPLCENHEVKLLIPLSFSLSLSLSLFLSLSFALTFGGDMCENAQETNPKNSPCVSFLFQASRSQRANSYQQCKNNAQQLETWWLISSRRNMKSKSTLFARR